MLRLRLSFALRRRLRLERLSSAFTSTVAMIARIGVKLDRREASSLEEAACGYDRSAAAYDARAMRDTITTCRQAPACEGCCRHTGCGVWLRVRSLEWLAAR